TSAAHHSCAGRNPATCVLPYHCIKYAQARHERGLALGQFEFDAAIALVGLFGLAEVDGLELAKAGGDQTLRRNTPGDEILNHGDRARGRQIPVRLECAANGELAYVGMAVDAENPGKVGWNLFLQFDQRAGDLVELDPALRLQIGPGGVEKHFGLQHEAVAHHTHVRTVAEDLTKLSEKIRTVALEFVYSLRQREIEPLTELGDARLRFLVFPFGGVERLLDRGELPAQRGNLLIEHLDLRQSARGDLLFALKLAG